MELKTIIFDLDNTLHDRRKSFVIYCEKFVEDYAEQLFNTSGEIVSRMIKEDYNGYRTERDFFTSLLNKLNWRDAPPLKELIEHKLNLWPVEVVPMHGMDELLQVVKHKQLSTVLLTNGHGHTQRKKMDALRLHDFFDHVLISGEVGLEKPDPEFFKMATDQANADPRHTIMVGDHQLKDIKGAQDLGITGVWITDGQLWDVDGLEPDYIITDLGQLVKLIKEWT